MSKDTFHKIEGTLRWSQLGYIVEVKGGGYWLVGIDARAGITMMGKQVVAEGTAIEFNLLDVKRIELADAPKRRGFWEWVRGR